MITLYLGKSAAGKDTFLCHHGLLGNNRVKPIVSYTTRPPRQNEINGIHYNFVPEDKFNSLINEGGLTEYKSYATIINGGLNVWFYGTPLLDVNDGNDYIGVVDISGARTFIKTYGSDNIKLVYIEAPDDIRKARAMTRGSFDETEWENRKAEDDEAFSDAALKDLEDYYGKKLIVINNADNNADIIDDVIRNCCL